MMVSTKEGCAIMQKKYVVRLTDEERETLKRIVSKPKGGSQRIRRAQVLLKADADGPGWTDAKIAGLSMKRSSRKRRGPLCVVWSFAIRPNMEAG